MGEIVLYSSLAEAAKNLTNPVVAIGNFDGVHRGHKALIAKVTEMAGELSASPAVLTFEPHPVRYFRPDVPPFRLTTNEQRANLLERYGIEGCAAIPFNADLASLTPEEFVDDILHNGLNASGVVVGEGFVFGKARAGDTDTLTRLCDERGIKTAIVTPVRSGEIISSTKIRDAVREADFDTATHLMGHPFALIGNVVHGAARGRDLGFPTANVDVENELLPPNGIYATWFVDPELGRFPSATYIGTKPTFDGESRSVEAYILDVDSIDLYERHVSLEFVGHVRGDAKFESAEALVEQMQKDVAKARELLGA